MSRVCFDFLADSILLDPIGQRNRYSNLSDSELGAELSAYREWVLGRTTEVLAEANQGSEGLGAYFGTSLTSIPDTTSLLRASLYFDRIVIDDPLFPHGLESTSSSETLARFFGYETGTVDRRAVCHAATLCSKLQPLVAGGLLKLVPASLRHEPPSEMGIS